MAVKIKSLEAKDRFSSNKTSTIHYIKVNKANKKGASDAIGGYLVQSDRYGDFHIELPTLVNGNPVKLYVRAGHIVFRTNESKRWQVGTTESLKKRFVGTRFV